MRIMRRLGLLLRKRLLVSGLLGLRRRCIWSLRRCRKSVSLQKVEQLQSITKSSENRGDAGLLIAHDGGIVLLRTKEGIRR